MLAVPPSPVKRVQFSAGTLLAFDKLNFGNTQKQAPSWSELEMVLRNAASIAHVAGVGLGWLVSRNWFFNNK